MHPFFRPKRALASAPETTPYQRAGQIWDDRMGLSLAHARNWRRIAVANLVLAGFLGAGWWVQATAVPAGSCAGATLPAAALC